MDKLTLEEKLELLQRYGVATYKDSEVELCFTAQPVIPVQADDGDFTVDWSGAQFTEGQDGETN